MAMAQRGPNETPAQEGQSLLAVLEHHLDNEAQGCEHGDTAVGKLGLPPPP